MKEKTLPLFVALFQLFDSDLSTQRPFTISPVVYGEIKAMSEELGGMVVEMVVEMVDLKFIKILSQLRSNRTYKIKCDN